MTAKKVTPAKGDRLTPLTPLTALDPGKGVKKAKSVTRSDPGTVTPLGPWEPGAPPLVDVVHSPHGRRRTPWGELRVVPSPPLECDQCGRRAIDPGVIPYDTTTGRPILSPVAGGAGGRVLCVRCWWRSP